MSIGSRALYQRIANDVYWSTIEGTDVDGQAQATISKASLLDALCRTLKSFNQNFREDIFRKASELGPAANAKPTSTRRERQLNSVGREFPFNANNK
jgi:hypothetical protein